LIAKAEGEFCSTDGKAVQGGNDGEGKWSPSKAVCCIGSFRHSHCGIADTLNCKQAGAKSERRPMTKLMPYLLFDGKCKEAMEFYHSCLGGELTLTKVKDSPAKDQMPAIQQDKVLNAHLSTGKLEISASDWLALNETPVRGNTVCLFLSGGTLAELKALFEKLSAGADRFGVRWMFAGNYAGTTEG
jgi:PhnB protein